MSELIDSLKRVPTLARLPDDQLRWLADRATERIFQAGESLFRKDDPIDAMHIILNGKIIFKLEQHGQFREAGSVGPFDITGLLPYSRAKTARGAGEAASETRVLSLARHHIPELSQRHSEMTEALVHHMTTRVRDFTAREQQDEKLMSLGKLSAGLAHELNNPASAVVRSAQSLQSHLHASPEAFKSIVSLKLTSAQIDAINEVLFSKIDNARSTSRSLLERSTREDEIADWLERHGVEDGFEFAGPLAEFDYDCTDLESLSRVIDDGELEPVVRWLDNVVTTEKMVTEIQEASRRIAELVQSIKTYTHMDQSPDKQPTDLRVGIDSTLTMLRHKLKKKNIRVSFDAEDDLPSVHAFVSELNQVWTNIIDNAVDAMGQEGSLTIKAYSDRGFVRVDVLDDGHGIPQEIQGRIFDPFFTTKALNEGTGLGLEIVMKIVRQHNGTINVESEPGRTEFQLRFPTASKK